MKEASTQHTLLLQMVWGKISLTTDETRHGVTVICNSNRLLHGFRVIVIVIDEANHGCNSNSNRRQSNR